ncbi:MAG: DUF1232 domain-containing protein [Desulfobacteraceae bacterium]|nr:DUF1232 domain-containing protein [Desulfobacteraceae bacterium]
MAQMGKNIIRYNIFFRLLEDFKLLVFLIKDYWSGEYRKIPYWFFAVILFIILYVISPFDLISDYIIGIGQIDDILILILCLYLLEKDLHKYQEWKMNNTS